MASIVPGYEYDIFISYRQKDNKYDGWVTEFVDNLKKELEATFKEEVSVYFDINPHDGLLETHDVDASLKEKLKCLVFIPIISRTYCDPKSFAWEHEFKAFVEEASQDMFRLKVKLSNGNVANRVLPVRIHGLNNEDNKLCESVLGGALRGVDFIYKSAGVNRPLRSNEDNPHDNLDHTIYRDQINKVANAINEIISSLKNVEISTGEKLIPPKEESQDIKKKKKTKILGEELRKNLKLHSFLYLRWPVVIIVLFLAVWIGIRRYSKNEKIQWAHQVQIPAIQKLLDENGIPPSKAFDMALELENIIPGDSELLKLWPRVAIEFPLETRPAGADVFWKDYNEPVGQWKYVGTSPIKSARFPADCFIRIKIEKQGYQTIYYAGPDLWSPLSSEISNLTLDSVGVLPENMVRIPAKEGPVKINGFGIFEKKSIREFLADRYEVTNKEFKRFMDSGGYNNKSYWIYPIFKEGKEISGESVKDLFVDKTGKSGPAGWEVGNYPEGQENYPVTGISWYEAAAYASFAGKKLPTVYHWSVLAKTTRSSDIIPKSNFNQKSTVPIGTMEGVSSFGISDIAGNVREWCYNGTGVNGESYNLGGGWDDPTYSFYDAGTQPSVDRSLSNGFRCIKLLPGDTTFNSLSVPFKREFRDYKKEKPVDEKTFKIFLRQYNYDKSPLNAKVISMEEANFWKVEKVSIDAGYNNERLDVYLFLPKGFQPPFQSVIFFPHSNAQSTSKFRFDDYSSLDFIIKSGRVLVFPIYKGTFDRMDDFNSYSEETVFYKDHVIMWRKDFGRTIDYLETRGDILGDKTGYIGWSWGAYMGAIIPAIERRIKAVVLFVGGLDMSKALPEVDQINYLPRIYQPVLMLNGKYDMYYPVETSQMPMFNLIGTPPKDKKILIYDTGHLVPRTDLIRETLSWYDKYLGPVK